MSRTSIALALGLGSLTTLVAASASAHISLEQGGTHLSRYGDDSTVIKEAPCGKAGGTRGTNVYTYAPGTEITVKVQEYIPHPSYFRFAFDVDGDDGFKDPVSIKAPPEFNRACPTPFGGAGQGTDHCDADDFYNTPEVLPGMDDLEPHVAGAPKTWTFQVKLPDVECDNCTLQVIQVMEDDLFHGPYDVTPGVGVPDVYHQCIDIVLKNGAPPPGTGGAPSGAGGADGTANGGAPSGVGGDVSGPGAGGAPAAGSDGGASSAAGTTGAGDAGSVPPSSSGDSGSCSVGTPGSAPRSLAALLFLGAAGTALALRRRPR